MRIQHGISKFLALALTVGLCITPEMFAQQTQSSQTQAQPAPQAVPPATSQPPASAAPAQTQPAKPSPNGTNIDPSQAPLQPVTTYPNATDQQQEPAQTTNPPEAPQPKTEQPTQPVGAATAERVPTAGGAAAKPAGAAIAPAKQHQTRGLLIKIGAIAAAGAALGTVYALSRGTGSLPPGAR
jgi:cytoskeletal protein RodZ